MSIATAEGFSGIVSQRVEAERHALAADWLRQLHELLTVAANEVFPSEQLLDHIPILIRETAGPGRGGNRRQHGRDRKGA